MHLSFLWVLTIGSTCFAVAGLLIAKRLIKSMHLRRHQEFVDAMVGVIGTLVAVLLGFMVAGALSHYDKTATEISTEARMLSDVHMLANGLPENDKQIIQKTCLDYCNTVIDFEWHSMEKGNMCPQAWADLRKLAHTIVVFKPHDAGETNLQISMIGCLQQLEEGRRVRDEALTGRAYLLVWPVIAVVSAILMLCTYMYATRGWLLHSMMLAFVAICLAMNCALLFMLMRPFSGEIRLQPRGFILDRQIFTERL